MTPTILELPKTKDNAKRDSSYAKRVIQDARTRSEAPIIIQPNVEWAKISDKVAVYNDYGVTPEMQQAMIIYGRMGLDIEYRKIGQNPDAPISICVFKWKKEGYRTQFTADHVNRFFRMIDRHVTIPHRKICITDDQTGIDSHIETIHLWPNPCPRYGSEMKPNCFYRLKMFDEEIENIVGPRFVWMDLDAVIFDNIDHILLDQAEFKMWKVDNESMECNGSLVMHKTGTRSYLWRDFNPAKVHPVTGLQAHGKIGSDQAWIATKLTQDEKENTFGIKDGVYSFRCFVKKHNLKMCPATCKILFFHGTAKPWSPEVARDFPWIAEAYNV